MLRRRRVIHGLGAASLLGVACGRQTDRAPARAPVSGPPRVVVIGGGLAGLTSALRLEAAGFEVDVLEASDRVGGRVHTHVEDGVVVELGATRALTSHPDLLALAEDVGVAMNPRPSVDSRLRDVFYIAGKRFEGKPEAWPVDLPAEDQGRSVGELRAKYLEVGVERIGDPRDPGWPAADLAGLDAMTRRAFMKSNGASPGAVHLLEMGQMAGWIQPVAALQALRFHWGNDFSAKFAASGGNESLPRAVAARLASPVRMNARVRRIEEREGGVTVHVADGDPPVEADYVLCCVPMAALGEIELDIPNGDVKRAAAQRVRHVFVTRLNVVFDGRPWRQQGLSGEVIADAEPLELWDMSTDNSNDPGVLTFYLTGQVARALADANPSELAGWCREQLSVVMPGLPDFIRLTSKVWPNAWTAWLPGQLGSIAHTLRAPTRRVAFATDELSPWPGWMQGAVYSANRGVEWLRQV